MMLPNPWTVSTADDQAEPRLWAGWHSYTPTQWFLPGAICIRGGQARRFASASGFCGGIHLEAR